MPSLAEKIQPESLDQVLGQEPVKRAIASWIKKDDFPRCILFTGPVGTGKSTLARIVARSAQGPEGWEGADIRQINTGSVGKVDDMRNLLETTFSTPFIGRYRVLILEEFHRATDAAQDALLVPMETNQSTMWILTSSEPKNVLSSIKSRCSAATFELRVLHKEELWKLINWVGKGKIDETKTAMFLWERNIRAPREVLGVLDQAIAGVPLEEISVGTEHEPLYKDIAGAVLSGNWTKASGLLAQVKTADSRGLTSVLSAFLRSELLKNPIGPRADSIATCLVGIDQTGFQDGTAYGAVTGILYKTAKLLSGGNK